MLRVAAGRFGKFSETYQLSKDVNADNMQATYDDGILKVVIPKVIRAPTFQHQSRASPHHHNFQPQQPRYVHPGYYSRSSPFDFFF